MVVIAFRMTRPERLFTEVFTDDIVRVLDAIELPAMSVYPSTALATLMTRDIAFAISPRIAGIGDPERATSCRNAITMASVMVDEIRLQAHAHPLDEAGQ